MNTTAQRQQQQRKKEYNVVKAPSWLKTSTIPLMNTESNLINKYKGEDK